MTHTMTVTTAQLELIAEAMNTLRITDAANELADSLAEVANYIKSGVDAPDCYEHFDFSL